MNVVVDWLLQKDQPSIRYHALTKLLDKPEGDPDVKSAHAMIVKKGWAADLLSKQSEGGWWVTDKSLYRPKYTASNWMLLVLADLGLDRTEPHIRKACELWIERFAKPDGGFGTDNMGKKKRIVFGREYRPRLGSIRLCGSSQGEESV